MTKALTVLARLLIAAIFLMSSVGSDIPNYAGVVKMMESEGVPAPQILLAGAIAFKIVGSIFLILGFKARFGASLLAIFLVAATYYFHHFWTFTGQEQQMQMIHFLKNVSMFGTMLYFIANGAGPASLDNRPKTPAGPVA